MKNFTKKIKNIMLGCFILAGSSALAFKPNDITISNLEYIYNAKTGVCEKNTFENKKTILKLLRDDTLIFNDSYVNDIGTYINLVGNVNGDDFYLHLMNNLGTCKMFEAIVIQKKTNVDFNQFKDINKEIK